MEDKKSGYITIAEYAKARNVSAAAVYKRLDGTLKKYVKEIDGKKFLSVEILAAEGVKTVDNEAGKGLITQEGKEEEAPASQDTTPPAILEALEALEKQLAEKDKQIERLQEEAREARTAAAEKDKFIQEQSRTLATLLEQSQELQKNNQILLGITQGMKPAIQEAATTPAEAQEDTQEGKEEEAPAKPGFWKRLFRGSK